MKMVSERTVVVPHSLVTGKVKSSCLDFSYTYYRRVSCVLCEGRPTIGFVQMTSSRVRLGQSFKTVGYGCASCWGDLGAGSVEADVFYIPFVVSVQYIGY